MTVLTVKSFKEKPISITVINNKFASSEDDRLIHFNVEKQDSIALAPINATIQAIQNRPTPAQEEIAYQVTQNVEMERYPRTALSKYNLVPTLPNNLVGTNTVQVSVTSEDTTKDFFVTRINDDQYRITKPFDPNNLPDSIAVYSVITRTKDQGYSKTLGNELKRIVVNNRQPRNSIKVAKQKPKTKFKQTTLFNSSKVSGNANLSEPENEQLDEPSL